MPATSGGPQQGEALPAAPPDLMPGMRWRRVFPGEERQLGVLRRWLASLLPESPARDDLLVVANELASNSIRHTASGRGGHFAVEITMYELVARVTVADAGGATEPRVIEDTDAEHGRGLLLVRGLSVRTGVCGDRRGRMVWADVRWPHPDAAHVAAGDPYEAALRDGEAALARRFAGVPAWFGRFTLQWWALPDTGGLVSAPSAQELAGLLYRLGEAGRAVQPFAPAEERPGARRGWAPGVPRRRAVPGSCLRPAGTAAAHPGRERSPGGSDDTPGRARLLPAKPSRPRVFVSPAKRPA